VSLSLSSEIEMGEGVGTFRSPVYGKKGGMVKGDGEGEGEGERGKGGG